MKRATAIKFWLAPVVCTLVLGTWVVRLRGRNAALDARLRDVESASAGAVADTSDEVTRHARGARRLERLRASLALLTDQGAVDPDARLRTLEREIAELEKALSAPHGADGPGGPVGEDYRRQNLRLIGDRQANLLARRSDVAQSLTSSPTPADRTRLEDELRLIDDELAEGREPSDPTPVTAADEHARRRAEHLDLEQRIADLRADLTYWSAVKSGAGDAGRQARVRELERQVQQQEVELRDAAR